MLLRISHSMPCLAPEGRNVPQGCDSIHFRASQTTSFNRFIHPAFSFRSLVRDPGRRLSGKYDPGGPDRQGHKRGLL